MANQATIKVQTIVDIMEKLKEVVQMMVRYFKSKINLFQRNQLILILLKGYSGGGNSGGGNSGGGYSSVSASSTNNNDIKEGFAYYNKAKA